MKRTRVKSVRRKLTFGQIVDEWMFGYLERKGRDIVQARDVNLAVFANEHIGIAINQYGLYEKDELQRLLDLIFPVLGSEHIVIDVGANIGNHTVFFSRYFSEVIAIEPNSLAFQLLSFNTSSLTNVSIYNAALGASEGKVILPANDGHPVKRVNYATEVNHDKTIRKENDIPEAAFARVQEGSFGSCRENRHIEGRQGTGAS